MVIYRAWQSLGLASSCGLSLKASFWLISTLLTIKPSSLSDSSSPTLIVSYYIYQPATPPHPQAAPHRREGTCLVYLATIVMGQNICAEVNVCCSTILQPGIESVIEAKNGVPPENHSDTGRIHPGGESSQAQPINQKQVHVKVTSQPQGTDQDPDQQEQSAESAISLEDLVHSLADIRESYLDSRRPKQLFLSIDQVWRNEMRLIDRPLAHYYTRLSENQYTRDREDNSKFQILFRQHFPKFGAFFYQITLTGYQPRNGCEFTIGVVNYLQAVKQAHSRGGSYEKSYTYRIPKDINEGVESIRRIDVCLRVEVNRESNRVAFYADHKEVDSKPLQGEIISGTSSLAPYLQTQGLGVTFSWSKSPDARSATYKMSTILEEESSIHAL